MRYTNYICRGSGVQRSDDARGDCLIGCPTPKLWYWAVAYGGQRFLWRHNMTSFTFAKQRFGEVCWRSMHIQGRQSSGREAVPSPCRAFVGFPPQTKLQATPNWIMKHYKSVEFLSNFRMSSPSVEKGRGAVKQLRAVETYKKIVTNYVCFYSWTMLTSKIITGIIENHSEFSGCRNSCIRFVSSRSW